MKANSSCKKKSKDWGKGGEQKRGITSQNGKKVTSEHVKTLGSVGYFHFIHCNDGFMGIYIYMSTCFKVYTLNSAISILSFQYEFTQYTSKFAIK